MSEKLKRFVPPPLRPLAARCTSTASVAMAYLYDFGRFMRYSSTHGHSISQQNLASKLTETYHNIEKGLSLPSPRPGFGRDVIGRLIILLKQYRATYGEDHVTIAAVNALTAYQDFCVASGLTDRETPHAIEIRALLLETRYSGAGGAVTRTRQETLDAVEHVGDQFFEMRASVRDFSPESVDEEKIRSAVRAAQKSPAVCNRQFSRVYVTTDRLRISEALRIQGGARGFADNVPALAVITTNLRNFWHAGERSQAWTDGGMFSMSFVLGLHAAGLGSVCLNWSKGSRVDREFRRAFSIPEEEAIIMLVAFGNLKETYRVAASPRPPLTRTLSEL